MKRRVAGLAVAIAAAMLLAGCTSDAGGVSEGISNAKGNYNSEDGAVSSIAAANRGEVVSFTSETTDGVAVDSNDYLGKVVVVNFWYAACPPCRVEAPDLQKLNTELAGDGVSFLGVNVRDQAETAENFENEFGLTYPSVIDTNNGNMLLAFAGTVQPNAVPTTIVLDKKGRVAGRILGQVTDPSILETMITATAEEN